MKPREEISSESSPAAQEPVQAPAHAPAQVSAQAPAQVSAQVSDQLSAQVSAQVSAPHAPGLGDARGESAVQLTGAEAAELAATVGDLMMSGTPLADGLEAVAADLRRSRLRGVLLLLAQRLREGMSLEQALGCAKVPPHVGILLLGGLRRRSPLERLAEYAGVAQQTADVPWRLARLMAYPVLVLVMLGFVVAVFARLAAEGASLLVDLEAPVPPGCQFLIDLAHVGPAPYVAIAATALLLTGGVWLLRGYAVTRLLILHALPWIGPLVRWNHTRHFAALLRLLLEEQIPLPEALSAAASANGDAALCQAVRRAARRVTAGASLAAALEPEPLLAALAPLVAWGESTNMLAEAWRSITELYDARVETRLAMTRAVLPPVLLVVVSLTVTTVMGASIGSMLTLIQALT